MNLRVAVDNYCVQEIQGSGRRPEPTLRPELTLVKTHGIYPLGFQKDSLNK